METSPGLAEVIWKLMFYIETLCVCGIPYIGVLPRLQLVQILPAIAMIHSRSECPLR